MLVARTQTAGRGQRGNSWEAEPGKNLTFSFYFHPQGVRPSGQFVISEAVALAIVELLAAYGIEARVKWPNDIYVGDKKIAGILIENSILGDSISRCIVGVGLNVNQDIFTSNAPNPVSMKNITGKDYDLTLLAGEIALRMDHYISRLHEVDILHKKYMAHLWRGDGMDYPFRDKATGVVFNAAVESVELSGLLLLKSPSGIRRYAFKEVEFL